MTENVFVLGAPDPEMEITDGFLREHGLPVVYAVGPSGQRVHPGNAHWAALPSEVVGQITGRIVLVECDLTVVPPLVWGLRRLDHHHQGDPGYGLLPSRFLEASSLGQVLAFCATEGLTWWSDVEGGDHLAGDFLFADGGWKLRLCAGTWPVPHDYVLAAAADHCLAAAYQGQCPGVRPDELMAWRAASRAKAQRRTVAEVMEDISAARRHLLEAPRLPVAIRGDHETDEWGVIQVADLRGRNIPELPEAAAREGIPFLASTRDQDGREKVVLQAAPAPLVSAFLAGEVVPGLVNMYGDPVRGFAGGYTRRPVAAASDDE
jgi:hypothetical protein